MTLPRNGLRGARKLHDRVELVCITTNIDDCAPKLPTPRLPRGPYRHRCLHRLRHLFWQTAGELDVAQLKRCRHVLCSSWSGLFKPLPHAYAATDGSDKPDHDAKKVRSMRLNQTVFCCSLQSVVAVRH